jgi:hypothetical protein
LLRTLILWTLSSSDTVKAFVTSNYKNRHTDDINIPISVQPWGSDSNKRRYFLIEGIDDTSFRVYRESNPAGLNRTWWSVAGTIEELQILAEKLNTEDGGPKARQLASKMLNSIPRFEATEEVRTTCATCNSTRDKLTCPCRNVAAGNTARCARSSSSALSLGSRCTKVAREVNV